MFRLAALALLLLPTFAVAGDWIQWRGPEMTGAAPDADPPVSWSADGGKRTNIRWRAPIEGHGTAAPIVLGDRVFVLTAVDTGKVDPSLPKPEDQPKRVFGITHPNTAYEFVVLCLDRATGQTLWRRVATETIPHEGHHNDASFASASPVTDGERVYCFFGSAGLFAYSLDGDLLWRRDLGKAYVGASLGEGSTPAVHDGRLVIVRDHARQSTIHTLDAATGQTLWEKDRDEPNAWATPLIVESAGRTQVITAASNRVRSYDLDSGEIIWECGGLTGNVTPCPVLRRGDDREANGDTVFVMSGYEGFSLLALPLDRTGDLTDSDAIRWRASRGTPYVPSPVLMDGLLYFLQSNQGVLSCLDAATGEEVVGRTRLEGLANVYASPVAAPGRLYVTGRNGVTLTIATDGIRDRGAFETIATSRLDDRVDASPAIAGDALFVRGLRALYCIAE